ncbi:MAG: hypothetical protein BWK78_09545 [Thiotrichaceae bacterium IS1]|nr:MAG: hypothetical protein BWK78_09545 [Thiotrichaceae bacterium IS1]
MIEAQTKISQELEKVTVKILIRLKDVEGHDSFICKGSGFLIAPADDSGSYVLTAHHCIKDHSVDDIWVKIRFKGNFRAVFDPKKSVEGCDIAVLKILKHRPERYLPLGPIAEKIHDREVIATGYPDGEWREYSGKVFAIDKNNHQIETDAVKKPGQSGGPVYHCATRRIIALAKGGFKPYFDRDVTCVGLATSFDDLFEVWSDLRELNVAIAKSWDQLVQFSETPSQLVYLAEVTSKLEDCREEIKEFLEQQSRINKLNLRILPDDTCPYAKVDFTECRLFVQLLDDETGNGYPQLQYDRAEAANRRPIILQWRDPDLELETVPDADSHRKLLDNSMAVIIEDFKKEIVCLKK